MAAMRARLRRRYGTEHHEFDLNPVVDLPAAIEELALLLR